MSEQPRFYGQWNGNPKGVREDPTRCVDEVWTRGEWVPHQCRRKRGHGPDRKYCKQHAAEVERRASRAAQPPAV